MMVLNSSVEIGHWPQFMNLSMQEYPFFWKSDTGVSLLKIWYMSIFWDWWYMSIFWDCMLIHRLLWNFPTFPSIHDFPFHFCEPISEPVGRSPPGVCNAALPFSIFQEIQTPNRIPHCIGVCVFPACFCLGQQNIQWNWSKSPAMNCWVFLLMLTFERWPKNSHSLDHLVFLHWLDEVHKECPTQHFRFRFSEKSRHPTELPVCVLPHFTSS